MEGCAVDQTLARHVSRSCLGLMREYVKSAYLDPAVRQSVLEGCQLPSVVFLSTGHGASSLVDNLTGRRLLATRPARTGSQPRRIRIRHGSSPRGGDPSEAEVPCLEIVHIPSKLVGSADEAARTEAFRRHMGSELAPDRPAPMVVVVVPATVEHLEDLQAFRHILAALNTHATTSPVYLVLSKADKVPAEDAQALVFDRLLAGMQLPSRPSEPYLSAFNGIFTVISGTSTGAGAEPGPVGGLAAYADGKLSALLQQAGGQKLRDSLKTRMGLDALASEITLQWERHTLLWLAAEAPAVTRSLERTALQLSALPEEHPSPDDVKGIIAAKADLGRALHTLPEPGKLPLVRLAQRGLLEESAPSCTALEHLESALLDELYGKRGSVEWSLNSPLLRRQLLDSCNAETVHHLAQGVLICMLSHIFSPPTGEEARDSLEIHRFHTLRDSLIECMVPLVLAEHMAQQEPYITRALEATLAATWHVQGGQAEAASALAEAAVDLAAELAVSCEPLLFGRRIMLEAIAPNLQECETAATQRARLAEQAMRLQRAVQGFAHLQHVGRTGAQAAAEAAEAARRAALEPEQPAAEATPATQEAAAETDSAQLEDEGVLPEDVDALMEAFDGDGFTVRAAAAAATETGSPVAPDAPTAEPAAAAEPEPAEETATQLPSAEPEAAEETATQLTAAEPEAAEETATQLPAAVEDQPAEPVPGAAGEEATAPGTPAAESEEPLKDSLADLRNNADMRALALEAGMIKEPSSGSASGSKHSSRASSVAAGEWEVMNNSDAEDDELVTVADE